MNHKKCSLCGIEKPESEYYLTGRYTQAGRNIPRAKCKKCVNDVKDKRRWEIRDKVRAYKQKLSCETCGYSKETHPNTFTDRALEFHHPNDDKDFSVGDAIAGGFSYDRILSEMKKCVVLCSRCHAEEHDKKNGRE